MDINNLNKKANIVSFVLLLLVLIVSLRPVTSQAYILPAEQLIEFMSRNFSRFRTIVVTRSVHLLDSENEKDVKAVFEEKLSLKSFNLYHHELTVPPAGYGVIDVSNVERGQTLIYFPLFLLKSKSDVMDFLTEMCVNIEAVAFTRLDGTVAYRIGDKGPESPKLLIDKERFLPLLMTYWVRNYSKEVKVTVRFSDYRRLRNGWYPFEITYTKGDDLFEHHFVLDFKANIPVDVYPAFHIPKAWCPNYLQPHE
jgi:hypothetical protein